MTWDNLYQTIEDGAQGLLFIILGLFVLIVSPFLLVLYALGKVVQKLKL